MTNDTESQPNGATDAATHAASLSDLTASSDATVAAAADPTAEAEVTPAEPKPPSFEDLGLHPDVKLALDEMGYFQPTGVQAAVYKPVSEGKDLLVQSRTGTGKTTAFGLPTISKIIPTHRAPQALILAPTRELALQVSRELTNLGKHRGIVVEPIYGGAPIGKQITNLRNGVHIVVGTPGRVLDHIGRRTLDCSAVQTFILDECDEMLSMGFLEDIERVVSHLPAKKQTLLFSATMPDEVTRYARRHMTAPEQISLSRDGATVADIHHAYYIVSGIARSRDLLKIIFAEEPESAIIFCNTRDETTMVARFLQKQGLDAEPLSSDLSQNDRERVMGRMKQHNLRFLCATDVAARGIDISNLSHVINYSVPESPEIYVHRTGRTGRAGKKGTALSLVGPRELGNFRYVRLQFGLKPEERLLPKDTIFEGKLKVPLPPIGVPQPPDPVQILIRGTPLVGGGPSDLEMKIFEKLLASSSGKRVIAQLVAERLNQLSTRSKPRRPPAERTERVERAEHDAPAPGGEDRGERRFDRDRGEDRGERRFDRDRPRFDRGEDRGERPRFDRGEDRGERPRFGRDGEDRGERRFDRGERPRFDRGEDRGERPDRERGERRFDRDRGEDRGERRFGRDRDRDRGERRDRSEGAPAAAEAVTAPVAETAAPDIAAEAPRTDAPRTDAPAETHVERERGERSERGDRPERGDRGDRGDRGERRFDRDRGERRFDRDRDRGERRFDRDRDRDRDRPRHDRDAERAAEPAAEPAVTEVPALEAAEPAIAVGTEAAPVVEAVEAPSRVDDVAARVIDRADNRGRGDRGDRKPKRDRKPEVTADTREFWETWAEEKSARVTSEPAPAPAPAAAPAAVASEPVEAASEPEAEPAGERRRGRDRGRDKDKGRSRGDTKVDRHAERGERTERTERGDKPERTERAERTERGDKPERGERTERGDKPERGERTERGDKPERGERSERGERGDKADRGRGKRDTVVDTAEPRAAAAAPAASGDGAQARLFVSLGKKHGVSADDLRGLLAGPIGGDKARIGSVSLRDSHAHVRVPEDLVDAIITGVHGTQHNEHDVTVERARA